MGRAEVISSATTSLNVDVQPGKPPKIIVGANGNAAKWAMEHREDLRALVTEHGSLLVRGLGLRDATGAEEVFRQFGGLMSESEAFAPRKSYSQGVYSSSKWPPNQAMCMHHELSYALKPPGYMLFACLTAAEAGGATPVAYSPAVLSALPVELVQRFERLGWLLVRNFNDDIGASFAEAFGTEDRRDVEAYCRANAIEFEWQSDGGLRTWQRRRAVTRHPVTGQQCWFNQVAFLNEWTLAPDVREYLVDIYGPDGLPFNTRFGNGDPIDADIIRTINEVYEAKSVRERWEAGDLLLVDNVSTAHGREAFEGSREIVVAMVDSVDITDSSPPAGFTNPADDRLHARESQNDVSNKHKDTTG